MGVSEEDMFLVLEFISFSSSAVSAVATVTITRGRSRVMMWNDKAALVRKQAPSPLHPVNPRLFVGFYR